MVAGAVPPCPSRGPVHPLPGPLAISQDLCLIMTNTDPWSWNSTDPWPCSNPFSSSPSHPLPLQSCVLSCSTRPPPAHGLWALPAPLPPSLRGLVSNSKLPTDATQAKRPHGRASVSCWDQAGLKFQEAHNGLESSGKCSCSLDLLVPGR